MPGGALRAGKEPWRLIRESTRLAQVPPVIPEIVDPVDGSLSAELIPDRRLQPRSAQQQQHGLKLARLGIFLAKPCLERSA